MKKWLLLAGVFFLGFFSMREVHAEDANKDNPPSHIKLDGIFAIPSDGSSSSTVIPGETGDVVEITDNGNNRSGAIWSTGNNLMDLSKDFEASMFIYFGGNQKEAADGMAFVLHNDMAMTTTTLKGDGAKLGVWDTKNGGTNWINNSFAVEFDTNYNDVFDRGVKDKDKTKDHIAWNFPGQRNAYEDSGIIINKTRALKHQDLQYAEGNGLTYDQWHPFKVSWKANATGGNLTYQLDNLPAVTVSIPLTTFNFQNGSTSVYWGFTGATGARTEMNRVVFEKVPGLVEAGVEEKIVNQEGDSVAGTEVFSGEKLSYELTGNYLSGKQDWLNVLAKTKINDNVTYVPGSLTLQKADGSMVALPDSAWNGKELTVSLQNLNLTQNKATLRFDATVNPVTEKVAVSESATFVGTNYLANGAGVDFTINKIAETIHLEQGGTVQKILVGEDYKATVQWSSGNQLGSLFQPILSGNGQEAFKKENPVAGELNTFEQVISGKYLVPGNNTLQYRMTPEGSTDEILSEPLTIHTGYAPEIDSEDAGKAIEIEPSEEYTLKGEWSDMDSDVSDLYYVINNEAPVLFEEDVPNSPNKGEPVAFETTIPSEARTERVITFYSVDNDGFRSNLQRVTVNSGTLSITFPDELHFTGEVGDIGIEPEAFVFRVVDTRGGNKVIRWKIKIKLLDDFKRQDGQVLKGSLTYTNFFSGDDPVNIEKGQVTEIFLNRFISSPVNRDYTGDILGLKLDVYDSAYTGSYSSNLEWIVENSP